MNKAKMKSDPAHQGHLQPCACNTPTVEMLMSTDTENIFDRLEWKCLFFTLSKSGLGNEFMPWQ